MRALETIAESVRLGYVHPTVMTNTLIQLENEGGLDAVQQLAEQLAGSVRALECRQHPHLTLAEHWLAAARAYSLLAGRSAS